MLSGSGGLWAQGQFVSSLLRFVPESHRHTKMHIAAIEKLWCECPDWNEVKNIPDSKSCRLRDLSSLCCRDPSLSADRQNSSTDPCLQAGIMPVPIEIFDSNPGPVWSCMPPHWAHILSGLQVSGHDTALGTRTQIKWTITHNLIELSSPALFFFFFFTNLTAVRFFQSILCSNNRLLL